MRYLINLKILKTMETIIETQIVQPIFQKIYEVRGQKVMLDFDLAELYGVEVKALNQAVKRNAKRFPSDFMFQLTKGDYDAILRCQIGTSKTLFADNEEDGFLRSQFVTLDNVQTTNSDKRGKHMKYLPHAFTEQGVAMLSGILNSDRAISVNIAIMRAFVAIRQYALNYADLSSRLDEFMTSTDTKLDEVFDVLTELTAQKKLYENRRPIGFVVRDEN